MPDDASPTFDVATIRPSDTSAPHGTGIGTKGSHLDAFNFPGAELISYAVSKLLASRFKLAFHYETRELPAYAIQTVKSGPKLTLTTHKPSDSTGFSFNSQVVLTVRNSTIAHFSKGLQQAFLDKPVVDQTGLQDRYDFDLK